MNVFFNKFLNKNKKIIQNYKCKSKNFFLIDRGSGHYITLLNSCIVGAAINKKYKINPNVISDLDNNNKHINLYRSFGYSQ